MSGETDSKGNVITRRATESKRDRDKKESNDDGNKRSRKYFIPDLPKSISNWLITDPKKGRFAFNHWKTKVNKGLPWDPEQVEKLYDPDWKPGKNSGKQDGKKKSDYVKKDREKSDREKEKHDRTKGSEKEKGDGNVKKTFRTKTKLGTGMVRFKDECDFPKGRRGAGDESSSDSSSAGSARLDDDEQSVSVEADVTDRE